MTARRDPVARWLRAIIETPTLVLPSSAKVVAYVLSERVQLVDGAWSVQVSTRELSEAIGWARRPKAAAKPVAALRARGWLVVAVQPRHLACVYTLAIEGVAIGVETSSARGAA